VWLCPAGISEDFINIENPMQECLHVFLPGKPFDETMLKDLDIDPSGISIQYAAIDRDPFIEYVADQILREMEAETSTGRLLIESLGNALSAHLVHTYSATAVRRCKFRGASYDDPNIIPNALWRARLRFRQRVAMPG
jgi:AraC family transcriptional regulator